MQEKFLCAFHMVGDLEKKIESHRKESSIKRSVEKPNQLFTKEDIQVASLTKKINVQASPAFRPKGKGFKGQSGAWRAFGAYGRGSFGSGKRYGAYGRGAFNSY